MFGKRSTTGSEAAPAAPPPPQRRSRRAAPPAPQRGAAATSACAPLPSAGLGAPLVSRAADARARSPRSRRRWRTDTRRSESYYETKGTVFGALIEAIDLAQLARLDADAAREEIRDIVNEIIAIKNIVMSISEQEELLDDICNDVLGYGPLEPLLARDDIADIMVNGSGTVYIEVAGKIQKTGIRFRDNQQLLNICQRIVSQIGRRVDESSPICDARLPDGSRVNVDRAAARDRRARAHHPQVQEGQADARPTSSSSARSRRKAPRSSGFIGRCRVNTIVSGGTGSGKTTLLNCLTQFIDDDERIITCEDAAELQLQQPHVVRLETRPPNLEGEGQVTMRDLVKNCLRMRPERIIVGEVRGPEAFDLLQAMNTGHDGSMGTLHANTPREALSRIESMITMGGYSLPSKTIREMIVRVGRRRRAGRAPARRLAQHHPHHRGDGHGRRRHHHPGPVRLRDDRRGRAGQPDRPPPLDRHRPAELLGSRALLRRGKAARPPRSMPPKSPASRAMRRRRR